MVQVAMGDLINGFVGSPLDSDLSVVSVVMLIKLAGPDSSITQSIRAGGAQISTEELFGAISGLTESIKQDLADDWD